MITLASLTDKRAASMLGGAFLLCCLAGIAHADFATAVAAYEKQDFVAAIREFHELAGLGHAASQVY